MVELKNVTLLGVDCEEIGRLIRAADICESHVKFAKTKLLSSIKHDDPRIIPIDPISKKEDYDKALTYYNNALLLNRKLNRKINISRNLTNIGNTYLTIEKYKLAEKYYTESKLVALEINYQMGICNNYRGLAASLLLQKRYNEALSNALKSRELARKIKV